MVKVRNELRVHNKLSRHPGTLLRTLPLPIHKILHPTSTATRAKEAPDRIHRTTLHERRRRHGGNQTTLSDWLDPGDRERRVDLHGPGKPKTYRLWIDDESDGKGQASLRFSTLRGRSRVETQTFWPTW